MKAVSKGGMVYAVEFVSPQFVNRGKVGGEAMGKPTGNHLSRYLRAMNLRERKTRISLALAFVGLALTLGGPTYLYPALGLGGNNGQKSEVKAGMMANVGQLSSVGGSVNVAFTRTARPPARIPDPASRPAPAGAHPRSGEQPFATATLVPTPTWSPTPAATLDQQTVELINQRRVGMGLAPLQLDLHLAAAARRQSNDIGPNGLCQHEGTDGTSPWDRIDQSGYTGFGNGEVVGCGYDTPQSVVDAWWNSPGHYAILTASDTNDIGCGWWLTGDGYGWQTCDTGISDRPTATRTATFTRTSTPGRSTNTPTPAPILVGHVVWQGRPPQPDALQQGPITLTLKSSAREVNFPARNTDSSGFFTVSVAGLANGTYNWRAKGPLSLANAGSVSLSGARVTNVAMGLERSGDANGDNMVSTLDLNIMKITLGKGIRDPGYDSRADFNGDNVIGSLDYRLLWINIGLSGAPPVLPGNP